MGAAERDVERQSYQCRNANGEIVTGSLLECLRITLRQVDSECGQQTSNIPVATDQD